MEHLNYIETIMSQAIIDTKICRLCKAEKSVEDFDRIWGDKNPRRRAACKACRKIYHQELAEESRKAIVRSKEWAADNKPKRRKVALAYYYRMQHHAIMAYGGYRCSWCGIDEPMVLCIDHVENNGREHRRQIGSLGGHKLYKWLRDNDYPPGFQVLCMNCNHGKYRNKGVLPESMFGRCIDHSVMEVGGKLLATEAPDTLKMGDDMVTSCV